MAQPARVINMDDHKGSGPQLENGYVRIANELYDEILRFKFTFRQLKVVFAVIRKTYGYGKKSDDISASQLGATCAMPRPHVASTLVELEQMGVLNRERGKFGTVTSINKNYKEWRSLKKREMEKVNEGFGGAVSRKPEDRLNHYVYRLDHDESGTFYIGVRSCDCLPTQDRYKGSGSWTATVRVSEIRKTILSTHDSRAEAEDEEKRVIREMSCVKGMGNRRRYVKGTEDELVQNLNTASTESVHDIVRNLNSSVVQNQDTQKTTFQKTTPKDNPNSSPATESPDRGNGFSLVAQQAELLSAVAAAKTAKPRKAVDEAALEASRAVWSAYSAAYQRRYGTTPIRPARVNAQVKKLIETVGREDAPALAGWFVGHPAQWYVTKGHDIGLLLADITKLHTEWATGRVVTTTAARQSDRRGAMSSALQNLLAECEGGKQ